MRHFSTVADDTLLEALHVLVGSHRRVTADLIAHLSEVDARRLHVDKGFSSLFGYCVERLGFSEDEACRRIEAARLMRRFPDIFSLLEDGTISLTVRGLLKHRMTTENHCELLVGVSGSSVLQAKEWLAARFPVADVPSSIRKLPERSGAQGSARLSAAAVASRMDNGSTGDSGVGSTGDSDVPASATVAIGASGAAPGDTRAAVATAHDDTRSTAAPADTRSSSASPALARATIEPLSRERFLVKFTASRAMKEKLSLACDLMRHANPTGDLCVVIERALDLLVAELENKKQGRTKRFHGAKRVRESERVASEKYLRVEGEKQRGNDPSPSAGRTEASTRREGAAAERAARPRNTTIARATRREVVARDGWRCSFVGDNGRRCDARAFVEFDHETPRGLGGTSRAENLRLLCRAHNRLAAERVYGREYVASAIAAAQSGR